MSEPGFTAMSSVFGTSVRKPGSSPRPRSGLLKISRAAGTAASFGILALAIIIACRTEMGGAVGRIHNLLFGQLTWMTLAFSAGWALIMFEEIVKSYRKIAGFPWFAALSFAAAAASAIMAMHAWLS
jgi:hypothetical protein